MSTEVVATSKSDLLHPKIPLVDDETGKRSDGRNFEELRQLYLQSNIRTATGSSLVEFGQTKVMCVIDGPKNINKKGDFSQSGILNVQVQVIGDKMPEKNIMLLKEGLESVVQLDKFPKCMLNIFFTILEDDGSSLATCLTAAGLALVQGGIPIYDTPIGTTLMLKGDVVFFDPTKSELQHFDLTDSTKNAKGGGVMTMGYMPSRDQICLLTCEGKLDPSALIICMDKMKTCCKGIASLIREHFKNKLRK